MLPYKVKTYRKEGSRINQLILAVLMVLPVFTYGMAVGWLSPMAPLLMSTETPAAGPVPSEVISWMASVPYLVGTPAVFVIGYAVDNFGRKKSLMFTSFCLALCWSLKLFSTATWALISARAILGLGVAGSYVVTPLYIKEISEDAIRGTLGSFIILSQNLGNLLVYILGEYLSYYATLYVCLAVPLVHLVMFTAMPETPSYLLKCGKNVEARETLAWLRCRQSYDPIVSNELEKLVLESEKTEKSTKFHDAIKTIVSDKSTFRAFRITLTITLARELCGCLAVLHFASTIFHEANAGWLMTPNQQAAVLGVVQLVGSCTASSLVERTGRKPLLGVTCFMSGLAMTALASWFYIHATTGVTIASWVPIAALCLCIYCDAAGLQPVPFVVMTEMFSFQLRGTVTTLVIAFACVLVSILLRVFHPIADAAGLHTVFFIFAGVCLVSTIYIACWVPETKMRSIDEIYAELRGEKNNNDSESGFDKKRGEKSEKVYTEKKIRLK